MRELQDGDIVNVDVSAVLGGWHADLNETFVVGRVAEETRNLIKATHDSLMLAISACKPVRSSRLLLSLPSAHAALHGAGHVLP